MNASTFLRHVPAMSYSRGPWLNRFRRWLPLLMVLALVGSVILAAYLAGYHRGILRERADWLAVPQNPFGPHP